jgi:luciferase family oxidoreductase group 1
MTPFSILDLAPIAEGSTASQALANSLDLARHAECWGYRRFWLAEHHNMQGIASAATAVVIGHVAGGTKTIRVGAGGVMLPNHAPLVVAEQFGTLEALFPGRIDLGLGRAPGTDLQTARALRREPSAAADSFPQDLEELQRYFSKSPGRIQAVPGTGLEVPIWLLGSSLFSARLAALRGLPFAFASHFAPAMLEQALQTYRDHFRPSQSLEKPYVMVAVNLFASETDEQARMLFTSVLQQFIALRFGTPGPLPPPMADIESRFHPSYLLAAQQALAFSAIGTASAVQTKLARVLELTGADELILTGQIYDHAARLRSFEIGAEVRERLSAKMKQTC